MKSGKQGREKSLEQQKKIEARTREKDKSEIFRRQEENFHQQRQGMGHSHIRIHNTLIFLGFPISINAR